MSAIAGSLGITTGVFASMVTKFSSIEVLIIISSNVHRY
jgi:hypothetical protein